MTMEVWHYWYLASLIMFLLEAMAIPGIGFFFAAIGAFILGVLVQMGVVPADNLLAQGGVFFMLTALAAAALWKPLKNFRIGNTETHNDVIGRIAVVGDEGLAKGKKGTAKWSGTIMTARLAADAAIESAAAGTELKIVEMQGSTLILAESAYPLKNQNNN